MKSGQRFIAGAVCPECQAMDVLMLNTHDQSIECVDCSYVQTEEQRDLEHKRQQQNQNVNSKLKKVDAVNLIKVTNIKS